MLSIIGRPWEEIDESEDIITQPKAEFNLLYEDEWLDNKLSREIITDIQGIDVTDESRSVVSILKEYGLSAERLATGTKNLLLCKFLEDDDRKCRMAMMGENCFKWLMDIADNKDICGVITTPVFFTEEDINDRKIYFPQINSYANTEHTFLECISKLILLGVI